MAFIQENLIEIKIGLKREYKLIHISDVHAVTYKDSDSEEAINEAKKAEQIWLVQREGFAKGALDPYTEEQLIPSKECLVKFVEYINTIKPNGVVLTGDIIDYYSESNYDMLLEQCGNINYPFVFACGNHESNVLRYKELTMDNDGFMVLEFPDFKLISLDNSTKKVTKETLNKLRKELRGKKPAIVSFHVPISTEYNRDEMKKYDPYFVIYDNDTDLVTKEFINVLVTNDNVKAVLCGHIHGRNVSSFAPGKMQCSSTSGLIGFVNLITVK